MFTPLEIPVIFGGNHPLHKKGRRQDSSFLSGFTQIALTRQGSLHLLSMMLNPSD